VQFQREHEFAATVEQVATLMSDPNFQTMLDLPDLARPDVVAHEVDGASHRLTLRYEYVGQLDPIAQKVVGGRKLTWLQELRIDVETGQVTPTADDPDELPDVASRNLRVREIRNRISGTH
jgi:hypothetical protein